MPRPRGAWYSLVRWIFAATPPSLTMAGEATALITTSRRSMWRGGVGWVGRQNPPSFGSSGYFRRLVLFRLRIERAKILFKDAFGLCGLGCGNEDFDFPESPGGQPIGGAGAFLRKHHADPLGFQQAAQHFGLSRVIQHYDLLDLLGIHQHLEGVIACRV